ncbi:hypothetical protein, partial [Methanobrevibacter sp.]
YTVYKKAIDMAVNTTNITIGDTAFFDVVLNETIDGIAYIVYGGQNYTTNLTLGSGTIEIPNLDVGDYTFEVFYDAENYNASSVLVNLTVSKNIVNMTANAENITIGDIARINVVLNPAINCVVYTIYGGKEYNTTIAGGRGTIEIPDLELGNYTLTVIYDGSDEYEAVNTTVDFSVKEAIGMNVTADNITYGDPAFINVVLNYDDAEGTVYILYNGTYYSDNITAGRGTIEIPNLNAGNYTFDVIYSGCEKYNATSAVVNLTVYKNAVTMIADADNITYGASALIKVYLTPNDAEGVVYIVYGGRNYTANLTGGRGTIEIPDLNAGNYTFTVSYDGSEIYNNGSASFNLTVYKHNSTIDVNVTDIVYGETLSIFVSTDCPDSEVYVDINGQIYSTTLVGGQGVINITGLDVNNYLVNVTYNGTPDYHPCVVPISFNVVKANATVNVSAADVAYGENALINVSTDCEDSVAYVEINGVTYAVDLVDGHGVINITDLLNVGYYTLNVIYNGTANYNPCVAPVSFNVIKANSTINVSADDAVYGENALINVSTDCEDSVAFVVVNDFIYEVELVDGHGVINITELLNVGYYHLYVFYYGTTNYNPCISQISFNVIKANSTMNVSADTIVYGENVLINVSTDCEDSVAFVEINGVTYAVDLVDGRGVINVTDILNVGYYNLNVIYNGTANYNPCVAPVSFNIIKANSTIDVSAADVVYGENILINVTTDCEDGMVYAQVNGNIYAINLVDGRGVINITSILNVGLYELNVTYSGTENYKSSVKSVSFNVTKQSTSITAKNATFVINYGGSYQITLNNRVANVPVKFTLNGKVIGTVKTDASGKAKITLTPAQLKAATAGKRNLIISFDGDQNHNPSKTTVKIIIDKEITKFTNVKSVKSSYKSTDKTMQLTATLKDSKNKVIKNQYVTFKVNNKKTFKVKTNSQGVALLTLNAANIKACNLNKPGNYKFTVTYNATATYSKTTGNATVKVL